MTRENWREREARRWLGKPIVANVNLSTMTCFACHKHMHYCACED